MLGNETNHLWSNCDINTLSLNWTQKLRDYLSHFIYRLQKRYMTLSCSQFSGDLIQKALLCSTEPLHTLFIYLSLRLEDLEDAFYIRHPT